MADVLKKGTNVQHSRTAQEGAASDGVIGHSTYSCSNTVLGVCEAHELSDGIFLRGRIWGRHIEGIVADSHSSQASRDSESVSKVRLKGVHRQVSMTECKVDKL